MEASGRKLGIALVAVSVIAFGLAQQVLAHSGGLDHCGGHHNTATGDYHYHDYERKRACDGPSGASGQVGPIVLAVLLGIVAFSVILLFLAWRPRKR